MSISAYLNSLLGWTREIDRHCLTTLFLLATLFSPVAQSSDVFTATLTFETEGIDLDTGAVMESDMPDEADGTDIRIAYNALRSTGAVVMVGATEGIELAFVSNIAFDGVTAESVAGLTFSPEPVDAPFSANDTVVVRTNTGAVFKLGNASESGMGVTFNYTAL